MHYTCDALDCLLHNKINFHCLYYLVHCLRQLMILLPCPGKVKWYLGHRTITKYCAITKHNPSLNSQYLNNLQSARVLMC